jgi:N-acetylglucosaminyldiphosphoundecaprenol N-acetyl-beta-D-mannosaminyltransferase
MDTPRLRIGDIFVHDLTPEKLTEVVEKALLHEQGLRLVTPNPEMIVASVRNKQFTSALSTADLALPDGVGLWYASRFLAFHGLHRLTGIAAVRLLCKVAAKQKKTVGVIGNGEISLKSAVDRLEKEIIGLKFDLINDPGLISSSGSGENDEELIKIIKKSNIRLLFVAFGAPKQELWAQRMHNQLPGVITIGVGGAFDYLGNKVSRAPEWVQHIGLEWLYRVCRQPKRLPRIIRAVIFFPCLAVWYTIVRKLRYEAGN